VFLEVEVREGRLFNEYYEVHAGRHSFVNEGGVAKHDEGGRIEHVLKYFTEYRVYRGDRLLRTLHGAGGFNRNFVTLWFSMLFGRVVRGATTFLPIMGTVDYGGGYRRYSPYGLEFYSGTVTFYPGVPLFAYNEDVGEFQRLEDNVTAGLIWSLLLGTGGITYCRPDVEAGRTAGRTGIVLGGPFCQDTSCSVQEFSVNKVLLTAYQLCPSDALYGSLNVGSQVMALDYRKLVFGSLTFEGGVATFSLRRRAEHPFAPTNIICESGLHGVIARTGANMGDNMTPVSVVMFANDVISTTVGECLQLASGEAVEVIAYLRVVGT